MKLHTDRNDVERSGVAQESAFRIKTTAKAFDVLSSGLYTDRILAVIRELSCNAFDAHVAAGKPKVAFEIHLPNSLEPWFHVRDEGTGLSHEQVMTLYSTYFDSTKTESNDFIGALGLGSKSPFSYTKAFEVISRHNNMRRMYSVFINEDGVPTIAHLGEFHTDELNGLEVKITVKREDFQMFAQRTSTALRWFPVKPKVIGYHNFRFAEVPQERSSGDNWKIFGSSFTSDGSKMTAVQGNVAYKVDVSKLGFSQADEVILNNGHIVGFFDIGELEVAASREEIRYDDRSKAALTARIASIRSEVMKQFEAKVNSLKGQNDWDIFIQIALLGAKVFGYAPYTIEFLSMATHPLLKKFHTQKGTFKLDAPRGHTMVGYKIGKDSSADSATLHRNAFTSGETHPDPNYVFFHNDIKTGGISRVEHYLRTIAKTGVYKQGIVLREMPLIYKKDSKPTPDKDNVMRMNPADLWTESYYAEERKVIQEQLGNIEVIKTSTLTAPPREKREIDLPVYRLKSVNQPRYGSPTVNWEKIEEFDINDGGLYFDIRNGSIITLDIPIVNPVPNGPTFRTKDCSWSATNIKSYLQFAVQLINKANGTSYKYEDVYGFGAIAQKKAKKNPDWTNIFNLLKPLIKHYEAYATFEARISLTDDAMGLRSLIVRQNGSIAYFKKGLSSLVDSSPFKLAVLPLMEDVKNFAGQEEIYKMMKSLDIDLETKFLDASAKLGYFGYSSFKDYPMLTFVDRFDHLDKAQIDLFFDYIRTIDKAANRS